MNDSFADKLARAQTDSGSLLCVGLDPDPDRLPASLKESSDTIGAVRSFCQQVIEATSPFTCAFKVNFAFFEALGPEGWRLLKEVSDEIPASKIGIADAKRGDIGNTGRFYAKAMFEHMSFDGCTVAPYIGKSSVIPFLQYRDKAAFVLARTSNADAGEIQLWPSDDAPLFRYVAERVTAWEAECPGTAGLVVGATDLLSLADLRRTCPELPFLVPGVGAQGGDLESVIGKGATGRGRLIINSSRSILYASADRDFAEAAGRAAEELRDRMRNALVS